MTSPTQQRVPSDVVFLLDVDNTLLDNDAVIEDLRRRLLDTLGVECQQNYWDVFEQLRRELGYADYLGALQRYRIEHPRDPHVLRISLYLLVWSCWCTRGRNVLLVYSESPLWYDVS